MVQTSLNISNGKEENNENKLQVVAKQHQDHIHLQAVENRAIAIDHDNDVIAALEKAKREAHAAQEKNCIEMIMENN